MIPSDHVEIAIHQDDIRGAPNTVGWSHEVWCKFCPVQVFISVYIKLVRSLYRWTTPQDPELWIVFSFGGKVLTD